jgi:copper(I)-binding protein
MPSVVQRPGPSTAKAAAATVLLPLLAVLALTGCGAGAISQTASQASAVNGYAGQVGNVLVRDATIAYAGNLGGAAYQPGGSAPLNLSLVNTGGTADRLLSVTSPVAASGQVVGDAVLPGGTVVTVGNNDGAASQALAGRTIAIKLNGLVGPVRSGLTYPVTFRFEKAGTLTAQVPVGAPSGALAERN